MRHVVLLASIFGFGCGLSSCVTTSQETKKIGAQEYCKITLNTTFDELYKTQKKGPVDVKFEFEPSEEDCEERKGEICLASDAYKAKYKKRFETRNPGRVVTVAPKYIIAVRKGNVSMASIPEWTRTTTKTVKFPGKKFEADVTYVYSKEPKGYLLSEDFPEGDCYVSNTVSVVDSAGKWQLICETGEVGIGGASAAARDGGCNLDHL